MGKKKGGTKKPSVHTASKNGDIDAIQAFLDADPKELEAKVLSFSYAAFNSPCANSPDLNIAFNNNAEWRWVDTFDMRSVPRRR